MEVALLVVLAVPVVAGGVGVFVVAVVNADVAAALFLSPLLQLCLPLLLMLLLFLLYLLLLFGAGGVIGVVAVTVLLLLSVGVSSLLK